jgi:hypothetical protein
MHPYDLPLPVMYEQKFHKLIEQKNSLGAGCGAQWQVQGHGEPGSIAA